MSPEAVARGAAALELRGTEGRVTRRAAGIPISVARTTPLPRTLTDDEWARVVMDLRDTFDARGTLRAEGPFREWSNGNLHVALEPGPDGERLQMRTRRSGGEVPVYFGGFLLILSAIVLFIGVVTGVPLAEVIREAGILGFLGAGGLTVGGVGQLLWSKERLAQMEAVSERTALLAAGAPEGDSGIDDEDRGE